jgi:hypothetical protein
MRNSLPGRRGRAPRTDAEWAREIQRRLGALESSTTVRIGPWVLSAQDGKLVATTEGQRLVLSDMLPGTTAP